MADNMDLKNDVSEQEEKGIAMELLGELKTQNKRLSAFLITVVALWFFTIIGFIWYLNQYDFTSTVEQTGFYTFSDSNGNVISSDIDDEQMKEILKIINGKNQKDSEQN